MLDLDEVVGDEHMPAVDELECGLGLADAAVADEQDAYAADVEQLAVDGVAGCERGGEIVHHVALNGGGGLVADKERSGMPFGDMLHVFRDGVLVRDDDAGHAFGEQALELLRSLFGVQRLEISHLRIAEDLDPVLREELVEPRKKQPRTVGGGGAEHDVLLRGEDDLELEIRREFFGGDRLLALSDIVFDHISSSGAPRPCVLSFHPRRRSHYFTYRRVYPALSCR